MGVFRDADQFYECVGELMDRAKTDQKIGSKIAKSGLIIQFKYYDPDALTTVDAKHKPSQTGAYVDVIHGPCSLEPDIQMSMKADVAHEFWQGKINLLSALAKKEIVTKGPIPKIIKLLPVVEPLYKIYPTLLIEKGYDDLLTE